jgi:hypothetical protein
MTRIYRPFRSLLRGDHARGLLGVLRRSPSPLFLRLMQAVPLQHRGIPLCDPLSLGSRHTLPPALDLFVSQPHIAAVLIEPSLSAIFFSGRSAPRALPGGHFVTGPQ